VSAMRQTMNGQPAALQRVLHDAAPVAAAADRLRNRRVFLVGTGTSFHAAGQGASLLRRAGLEAWRCLLPTPPRATRGPPSWTL